MTGLILTAMPEEHAPLDALLKQTERFQDTAMPTIKGSLHGHEVIIAETGIGKVDAACHLTQLAMRFQPSWVITTGSAGGIADILSVGDVVVADRLIYHDADAVGFGYELGQIPRMPTYYRADTHLLKPTRTIKPNNFRIHHGLIASGDSFVSDTHLVTTLKEQHPDLLALDMESTALA